jgi:hypothetical protein
MEMSGQLHALPALPQRKYPRCPLSGRLGGPRSWYGHFGEDYAHCLLGFEPWIVLAIVTIQTMLSWLTTIASSKSRSKNSKFGTFVRHFGMFFKIFWEGKFGMKGQMDEKFIDLFIVFMSVLCSVVG